MAVTFIDKRKVWDDLLKQFESMKKGPYVAVGFPQETTSSDIVIIAASNHYGVAAYKPGDVGSWHIPPRPFIAMALDARKLEINDFLKKMMDAILERKLTPKRAMGLMGQKARNIIYKFVDSDYFKLVTPNALATIIAKKSTRPLINHRTMLNSMNYVVRNS